MTDNKSKKKADGRRVALSQDYEREYLLGQLKRVRIDLACALDGVRQAEERLRSGFPAARKRMGNRK